MRFDSVTDPSKNRQVVPARSCHDQNSLNVEIVHGNTRYRSNDAGMQRDQESAKQNGETERRSAGTSENKKA